MYEHTKVQRPACVTDDTYLEAVDTLVGELFNKLCLGLLQGMLPLYPGHVTILV